jgi:hypothetical protein
MVPASSGSAPAKQVEKRGLARAVRSDDSENFRGGQLKRHVVDDAHAAEGFGDALRNLRMGAARVRTFTQPKLINYQLSFTRSCFRPKVKIETQGKALSE